MDAQKETERVVFRLSKSKKGLCCFMGSQMWFTSARQVQKLLDGKVDSVKLRQGTRQPETTKTES